MKKIFITIIIVVMFIGCSALNSLIPANSIKEGEKVSINEFTSIANKNFHGENIHGENVYLIDAGNSFSYNSYEYVELGEWQNINLGGLFADKKYKVSKNPIEINSQTLFERYKYGMATIKTTGERKVYPIMINDKKESSLFYDHKEDNRPGDDFRLVYGIFPGHRNEDNRYFTINFSQVKRVVDEFKKQEKLRKEFNEKTKKYTKQGYSQDIANYYTSCGEKEIKGHKKFKRISFLTFEAALESGIGIDNYVRRVYKYTKLKKISENDLENLRDINPYGIKGQPYRRALSQPYQLLSERSALYKIKGVLLRIDFPNSQIVYGDRYRPQNPITMYAIDPYKYTTVSNSLNIIPRFVVVK